MTYYASFTTLLVLALLAIASTSTAHAQERTAGRTEQPSASWDKLKAESTAAGQKANDAQASATKALETATKIETCGKLGMVYAPGAPGANASNGCRSGVTLTKCHERVGGFGVHVYCGSGQVATKVCSSGKHGSCRAGAGAIATTGSMTRDGWIGPSSEQKLSGPSTNFTVITCCSIE